MNMAPEDPAQEALMQCWMCCSGTGRMMLRRMRYQAQDA